MKQQWATSQAEWSKTLEQAQLSHKSEVQGLQQQLHDALEGRARAEGELTYKFESCSLQCMLTKMPTHQFRNASERCLS